MSVPTLDGPEGGATTGGMLGPVNSVMGAIFDSVAAEEVETPTEPGAAAPDAPGVEPPAPADGTDPPADPAAPADGGEPTPGEPGAEPPKLQFEQPVVAPTDAAISQQFSEVATALDERFNESFEQQAIEEAQETYSHYIDMLQLHPMELIGKPVPSIDGSEDDAVFRTADEIQQYQDAVRTILQRTLQASVEQKQRESNEVLDVVHASIELFQNNPDLVPGSKSYNKELASRFVKLAEPYALKMNGKLTGYSIPVQGLVDQVRAQVKAAAPAGGAPPAKKAAAKPGAAPQAGIPSKAGASGAGGEDFAPMWKALGIDNVPI